MKNFLLLAFFSLMSVSVFADITFSGPAVDGAGRIVISDTPLLLEVSITGNNAPASSVFELVSSNNSTRPGHYQETTLTPILGGAVKSASFTISTTGFGGDAQIDPNNPPTTFFLAFFANQTDITPLEVMGVGAVLPVELVFFDAKNTKEAVELNWATSMELNNDYFTVERSFDGNRYEAVSKIDGAGDSQEEVNYAFSDENVMREAVANTVYYRLKQTDFDGAFAYSDVVTVELTNRNDLEISNVAMSGNDLTVSYTLPSDNDTEIQIFDMNGRLVAAGTEFAVAGFNNTILNLNNLNAGIYIVRLTDGRNQTVRKFVK